MSVPHGRTRLVAVVATLLTATLPAITWAQSPPPSTASAPPSASAPSGPAAPSASPAGSASPAPLWTPPAVSGPVTLLLAGLDGDARARSIADAFRATLAESCPQATLETRHADTAETQAGQGSTATASGSRVLVLDPVDPTTAGAIVQEAQTAGAAVIALGDDITGALPDLQVAYDGPATGSIVGSVVVQVALEASEADIAANEGATPLPSDVPVEQVVLIDGPVGDALLAAWTARVKEGLGNRATIVHEVAVEELSAAEGQRVIGEAIAAVTSEGFGAVITPSDAVAAGVIAGLVGAGLVPGDISVTGLGGTLPGTQAIVTGDQLLTTWTPDASAAGVAAALACGQATGVGLPEGLTTTAVDNGTGEVTTVQLTGIVVTRDGTPDGTRSVEDTIVADEAYGPDTVASICTDDLAQACDDLGLVLPSPSAVPSSSPAPETQSPSSAAPGSAAPGPTAPSPTAAASPVPAPASPGSSPATASPAS